MLFFALAVAGCRSGAPTAQATAQVPTAEPTQVPPASETPVAETASDETTDSAASLQTFDEIGLSLLVPNDLYVERQPIINADDNSSLDAYLFYIQNYGSPDGPSAGNFQMYGHIQFDIPPVTWESFAEIQNNTNEYSYVEPIEINGLKGFSTQFAGERNNYVYLFFLDGHILTIAVSDPTPENKVRAEDILSSMVYSGAN